MIVAMCCVCRCRTNKSVPGQVEQHQHTLREGRRMVWSWRLWASAIERANLTVTAADGRLAVASSDVCCLGGLNRPDR